MIKLIASTLLGLLTAGFFITSAWSLPEDAGKTTFKASKCSSCHSVKSQGIAKGGEEASDAKEKAAPDLSTVGVKRNAAWISKYLLKKETIDGDKHLKKFKGSEEELEVLSNWLATLKSK